MFLSGHTDKFLKEHDRQIKKNACKNAYLWSFFIPEKYVIRVLFVSPWTSLTPYGGGTIFKVGGGPNFGSQKWRVSADSRACATQGGVWEGMCSLRSRSFFENVAIWCTIFHHFKHFYSKFTAGVSCTMFRPTLEQEGQKSGGAMPPSLKSGGATGPLAPLFRRLCLTPPLAIRVTPPPRNFLAHKPPNLEIFSSQAPSFRGTFQFASPTLRKSVSHTPTWKKLSASTPPPHDIACSM